MKAKLYEYAGDIYHKFLKYNDWGKYKYDELYCDCGKRHRGKCANEKHISWKTHRKLQRKRS